MAGEPGCIDEILVTGGGRRVGWLARGPEAGAPILYLHGWPSSRLGAVVAASGTSGDPQGYGQAVARRLFPDVLPYQVGTPASYSFAAFNGRTLADNAPEAMLSLVTSTAVPSRLKPSVAERQRGSGFPYVVPA